MRDFFAKLLKSGAGTEVCVIELDRFLRSDMAIVDGSWTITGMKDANGKPRKTAAGASRSRL